MARPDRYWLRGLFLPLGLYVLASLAIAEPFGLFFFIMLGVVALSVTLFYWLFTHSHFTTFALTNVLSDLLPASSRVRAIASLQFVIAGWLIIFGFSRMLRYACGCDWREQRRHGHY